MDRPTPDPAMFPQSKIQNGISNDGARSQIADPYKFDRQEIRTAKSIHIERGDIFALTQKASMLVL